MDSENSIKEFITVSSFLLKTYDIVSDPNYQSIIRWSKDGDAFIILNTHEFCDKVLPVYFKHKNLSSFVRQLNIYGFKKSKHKNDEQCFTHKDFRRDNKKLLLNMKRKIKDRSGEKKSKTESEYMKRSEIMQLVGDMNDRIKDQDSKIEQLIQVNREFKNSVLALYTELEKSKEREKQIEKILIDLAPLTQKANTGQLLNEQLSDQLKEKFSTENMFRLENSDLLNLFRSFVENFIQKLGKNDVNNMYYDNRNNYNYYPRRTSSPGSKILPLDAQKSLI